MFLEVHVLQNFALSNLNRDDTGAPKTCEFGGVRRARISSQCLKRAIRTYFRTEESVPASQLGQRTRRLKDALVERFEKRGLGGEVAEALAVAVIEQLGLKLKKERTEYLLFLGSQEIDRLASLALDHREVLVEAGRAAKKAGKGEAALQDQLLAALDGGDAIDLALFGRMIADKPEKNVDAAVQMAHAISTHAVATEFDFYSAVDDLQEDDDEEGAGAGMLGTTLYNSACYYRYANLDFRQLVANLGNHQDRGLAAARAFLKGMIHAVPTGKQNATAAQNPPALILVTVREKGLWSLANAFVKPIRPTGAEDVITLSAQALLAHFAGLARLYGTREKKYAGLATYLALHELPAPIAAVESEADLVDTAIDALAAVRE